jgi:hypothetical protein
MICTASLSFNRANQQVEGMIQQGAAFGRVEGAIDAAGLSQRHKAALWLLAWSLRDPAIQRSEARLMAAAFAAEGDDQPAEQSPSLDMSATAQVPPADRAHRNRHQGRRHSARRGSR